MKSLKVLGIAALLVGGVVVPFSAASASIISNQTTATLMSGSSVTFSMGVTSDDHNVWISSQQGGTSGTGYVTKVNIDTSQAAIIQDPGFTGSFRDFLNQAEKLHLVDDVELWMSIRELRNISAHDYTDKDLTLFFKRLQQETPLLIALKNKLPSPS